MKPTLEYIRKKYPLFNQWYFGGKLPDVPIIMSNAATFLGKVDYTKKRTLHGIENCNFKMRFSNRYDISEDELIDIIIHEMIHLYILYFNINDSSPHGQVFRKMMNDINARFGRHITISHKAQKGSMMNEQRSMERIAKSEELKKHYICIAELSNGEKAVVQAASTRLYELNRKLPHYYDLKSIRWYGSISPFWNKYPNSITPKLYHISTDDLDRELLEMVEINL